MNPGVGQYSLCLEIMRRLDRAGMLEKIVLVGSWCTYFYRESSAQQRILATLRTDDVDFLVPRPLRTDIRINVPAMFSDLGFIIKRNMEGLAKLEHADLSIEFLVPERGRGSAAPYFVECLGISAQPLRFLDFLLEETITVKAKGVTLRMPHPHRFGLHKLIVSERRTNKSKAANDREQGMDILREAISSGESGKVKKLFGSLPKGWRSTILKALRKSSDTDQLTELFT